MFHAEAWADISSHQKAEGGSANFSPPKDPIKTHAHTPVCAIVCARSSLRFHHQAHQQGICPFTMARLSMPNEMSNTFYVFYLFVVCQSVYFLREGVLGRLFLLAACDGGGGDKNDCLCKFKFINNARYFALHMYADTRRTHSTRIEAARKVYWYLRQHGWRLRMGDIRSFLLCARSCAAHLLLGSPVVVSELCAHVNRTLLKFEAIKWRRAAR